MRVVCLHNINDREKFRERMKWVKKRGEITVTFDDGYAGWMENVVPVLRELKIPAVFFVNSGAVDGVRVLGRKQNFEPLSSAQLRELAQDPLFEIGGHGTMHRDLGKITSVSDLEEEIIADKAKLEAITGKKLRWFAYSYGRPRNITPAAIETVKKAGYEAAFTIVRGQLKNDRRQRFLLSRYSLDINDSLWWWKFQLDGRLDWLFKLKVKLLG